MKYFWQFLSYSNVFILGAYFMKEFDGKHVDGIYWVIATIVSLASYIVSENEGKRN